MKFLLILLCLLLCIPSALAQNVMTVDGDLDDWTTGNRCATRTEGTDDIQPGNVSEPNTIDIRSIGGCLDFNYDDIVEKKYFGYIKAHKSLVIETKLFNGEELSCYDYYLDSDEAEGSGTTDHVFYHSQATFSPSYRLRFCGNDYQIKEVRFQVWEDSQGWIGEPNISQPFIDFALSEDKTIIEFNIKKLHEVKIYNPMKNSPYHRPILFAALSWQNDWWDITPVGSVNAQERNPRAIKGTTWEQIKLNP